MNVKKMMSILLISHLIWSAAFKLLDHSWKPRSHHQRRLSQVDVWSPCKFEVHGEITERTRHVVKEKFPGSDLKIAAMLEAVWTFLRRWYWMRDQTCLNQAGFLIIMNLISGRFDHTSYRCNDYCVCPKKDKCSLHFELSFCFAVKAKSNSPLYRCISK